MLMKSKGNHSKKKKTVLESDISAFNIIISLALILRLILFLLMVVPSLLDREIMTMGGGTVIAFLYFGPSLVADLFFIVFFICVNVAYFGAKKRKNNLGMADEYYLIAWLLLEIWIIFAIVSILLM